MEGGREGKGGGGKRTKRGKGREGRGRGGGGRRMKRGGGREGGEGRGREENEER